MSQGHSGRQSRSDQGPGNPSEIGSALSRELSFVFEDPPSRKETTTKAQPSDKLPERFIDLANDLSREEGQLKRRSEEKLDGPRRVWEKLAELKNIDLIRYPYQRLTLQPWHKLVIIAATVVDRYLGKNDLAASTIIKLSGRELAPDTVTRDKRVVLEMIQLTDHLYSHWKHDFALELPLIMNTPISTLHQLSAQKFSQLRLLLQELIPSTKIKCSIKPYIPFLVLVLRPEYELSEIQKALNTFLFDQTDWEAFREALDGPAPKYDPIRDTWINTDAMASQTFDLDQDDQ